MGKNVICHQRAESNMDETALKLNISGFTGDSQVFNGDYVAELNSENSNYISIDVWKKTSKVTLSKTGQIVLVNNQLDLDLNYVRRKKINEVDDDDESAEFIMDSIVIFFTVPVNISDLLSNKEIQFKDGADLITITLPELIVDEETIDIEYTLNEKIEDKTVNFYIDKTLIEDNKLVITYDQLPENIEIVTNSTPTNTDYGDVVDIVDSFIISGEVINNEVTSSLISVQYPPLPAKEIKVNWITKILQLKVSGLTGEWSELNDTYEIKYISENVITASTNENNGITKYVELNYYPNTTDEYNCILDISSVDDNGLRLHNTTERAKLNSGNLTTINLINFDYTNKFTIEIIK